HHPSHNTEVYDRIYQDDYYPPKVLKQGLQILESVYLLSKTNSMDTLKGRYEFLNRIYPDHIKASNHPRFTADMQKSIDHYKTVFYERVPTEEQMNLLIKPNIENLRNFYPDCVLNCFQRFFDYQKLKIESLIKEDAKTRRIKKLRSLAAQAELELKNNCTDKNKTAEYRKIIQSLINSL
ncbi:MAG: hypothetical protein ACLFMU_06980, partial [Bacteroidales bacterium]